jgi:hypothetical protein
MPSIDEFLESWAAPYAYGDPKPAIRAFLEAWRAAQSADAARSDPYYGKRETLVLPERQAPVRDRGVTRKSDREE